MKIKCVELENFRNYDRAAVKFDDGLNVLYGENASGKTNLLESIYYCAILKSPRTLKDKELIKIGAEKATIKLVVEKKFRQHRIDIQIDANGKKKVFVDKIPVNRAGELLGVLGVVFFSPDEMKLIKDSPQERRRFLDVGISQQQKNYFAALQRYNKILKQKNNLLKEKYGEHKDDMLDIWDAQLAKEGAYIIKKRMEYIEVLNVAAGKFHKEISSQRENLKLTYETNADIDSADLENSLLQALKNARDKDKELGYSTVGAHRDDIKIEIDGKDSRKFASQGQQRTVALAMKLGEVIIFKNEMGEEPVLLLDDVLSELDETRQRVLLKMTQGFQTILTCTEYKLDNNAKTFNISQGKVL